MDTPIHQSKTSILNPFAEEFYPQRPPLCIPTHVPQRPTVMLLAPLCYNNPSRAVMLSSVSPDTSETVLRKELEVFGDIRSVQMERAQVGIVIVYFYDLRHAHSALRAIQNQNIQYQCMWKRYHNAVSLYNCLGDASLSPPIPPPSLLPPARDLIIGQAVWADFIVPNSRNILDGHNQGTLMISNMDPLVSIGSLSQIFETFGPVRVLVDTPERNFRYVEYYDTRDAAKALTEINGREVHGRRIVLKFKKTGGDM